MWKILCAHHIEVKTQVNSEYLNRIRMKKRKLLKKWRLVLLVYPFFLCSCSPRVITHIENQYPPSVTAEEVRLYEWGDTLPPNVVRVGTVKVRDTGFSTQCNYEQVIKAAKQKTAQNGGNILALTNHQTPSFISTCHQIEGTMLWANDTLNAKLPYYEVNQPSAHYLTKVQTRTVPEHTLYANLGYAFITSNYYLPRGATGNPKNGLDWQLGYDWVSWKGMGVGLMYTGYKSSFNLPVAKINVGLTYVAPQFVMKQEVPGKSWIFEGKFGLGYFSYRESAMGMSVTETGVGYNFQIGAEYLINNHIGMGANFGYIGGILPDQDDHNDETTGVFRLNMNIGLRIHF